MGDKDNFADRIRAALDGSREPEPRVAADTPLEQLRDLAATAGSEHVRVAAAKTLLAREEAQRARRDEQKRAREHAALAKQSTVMLEREVDGLTAAQVALVLADDDAAARFPLTARALASGTGSATPLRARSQAAGEPLAEKPGSQTQPAPAAEPVEATAAIAPDEDRAAPVFEPRDETPYPGLRLVNRWGDSPPRRRY